jgi:hypothetical protein
MMNLNQNNVSLKMRERFVGVSGTRYKRALAGGKTPTKA